MHAAQQARADRRYAIAAGVFFIIATFLLFVGEAFYKPVLEATDALSRAAPERGFVQRFGLVD